MIRDYEPVYAHVAKHMRMNRTCHGEHLEPEYTNHDGMSLRDYAEIEFIHAVLSTTPHKDPGDAVSVGIVCAQIWLDGRK